MEPARSESRAGTGDDVRACCGLCSSPGRRREQGQGATRGSGEATVPNRQRRAAAARVTGGAGGRLTQARATLKAVGNLSLYKLHRSLLYCKIWYVHL